MFDQLIGLVLLGLGIKTSLPSGNVQGDSTVNRRVEKGEMRGALKPTKTPRMFLDGKGENAESESLRKKKLRRENESELGSEGTRGGVIREAAQAFREDMQEAREKLKEGMRSLSELRQEASHEARQQLLEEVKLKREQAREAFAQKREAFQEKIETIRDERKKALVARLDRRMNEINIKRTDQMSKHLTKMREVVEKIKVKKATLVGKDTVALDEALEKAEAALTTAESAVKAQAAKDYTITIPSEDQLKNVVGAMMKKLEEDLKAVHRKVVDARKAVSGAVRELAKLLGE